MKPGNNENIKGCYRSDVYEDWDDRQEAHHKARYAAEQEIQEELEREELSPTEMLEGHMPWLKEEREAQEELNGNLSKEYKDLLIKDDGVDRSHYQTAAFEPIEIIEAYGLGFNLGNAIKYILRAPFKGSFKDDLKKSIWYLEREIGSGNHDL